MAPNTRLPSSRGLNTSLPFRTNAIPDSEELSFLSDETVTPSSNATQGHNYSDNIQDPHHPPGQELSFLSEASSGSTAHRFPSATIPDSEELSHLSDVTITQSPSVTRGQNNNNTQHYHHPSAAPTPVCPISEDLSHLSDASVIQHSSNVQHHHHPPATQTPVCPVSEDLSHLSDATNILTSGPSHAHNSNTNQIQRYQPATSMSSSQDSQPVMAKNATEVTQGQPEQAVANQPEIVDLEDYVEPSSEPVDNLYFRQDDGTFISCRVPPGLGMQLVSAFPSGRSVPPPASTRPEPRAASSRSVQRAARASRPRQISQAANPRIPTTDLFYAEMDHIFNALDGVKYDRKWMAQGNIDENILAGWTSKHKLDQLVRHGAVIIGDKLRIVYESEAGEVVKEAEVLPETTGTNLLIRIREPTDDDDGILRGAQGPTDFIDAMNDTYAEELGCDVRPGWKEVEVLSASGESLGSLHMVRQAYDLWDKQKKLWLSRKAEEEASNNA